MRPFRFGASAWEARARAEWRDTARQAEDLGFSVLLVPDHVGDQLSPLPALVAAAEATTTLRVGTFVLDCDFRPPALLAMEAATVDLLTDGRLELGLGAGWLVPDYDALGMPFEAPGVRVSRLERTVAAVRERAPSLPLLIGGGAPRLLGIAARSADIVSITGLEVPGEGGLRVGRRFTDEGLSEAVEVVRSAAGDRFDALELNMLVQGVVDSAADLPEGVPADSPFVLVGDAAAIADTLVERRERFGVSYYVGFATRGGFDRLAPAISRLR